jgi:CDP-diglyceride synthetase
VPVLQLIILSTLANSAPVLARHLFGDTWQQPIDAGLVWRDGRRVLGRSKTWRGLFAAIAMCALAAPLLGVPWQLGMQSGALAMGGDLVASFIKRRIGLTPGERAPRLDSVPEALLPVLVLRTSLSLSWLQVALVVAGFVLVVRLASPLLYSLRLRSRPW